MRAGTAERHGLGSEELRARNQRLVYCSIEAFGPTGPLAGSPGYDPLMQAFAGLVSITGEPDRPGRAGRSLGDRHRHRRLGRARHRRRAARAHARPAAAATSASRSSTRRCRSSATSWPPRCSTGVAPGRHGTAFPLIAPYEVFATADGELMIAAANDRLFRLLCERIGLPELADDPRFRSNPDRLAHRDELLPQIRERLASESSSALARRARRDPRRAGAGSRAGRRAPADAGGRDAAGRRGARGGRLAACRSIANGSSTIARRRGSASTPPRCCASSV